jgi:hypothetical protein
MARGAVVLTDTGDGLAPFGPDVDAVHEARLVLFANAGLVLAALVGIHTVDDAAATMNYLLDRLFASRSV